MSRLDWIHENLWPRAVAAARSRSSSGRRAEGPVEGAIVAGDVDGAWAMMQGYDPTPGHEVLAWLLRRWTAGAIRGEDLEKARVSILAWSKTKQRLPVEARDIGRYKTLAQLDRVLMDAGVDFDAVIDGGAASGKAAKREHADRIREVESIVLLDPSMPGSDGWTIAVPLTLDAAQWWGRGTRWCTTMDKENSVEHSLFHFYNEYGPLVVFVAPDGRKWQWHPWSGQFADAADEMVLFEDCGAFSRWPGLLQHALSQSGYAIAHCRVDMLTDEMLLAAVRRNGGALRFVSGHRRTAEICLAAVAQDGLALEYVPDSLRTQGICQVAVQQDGNALQHVPEHLRTADLCLTAVRQSRWALRFVPEILRTEDLCKEAISQAPLGIDSLPAGIWPSDSIMEYIPPRVLSCDLCLEAVRHDGLMLKDVPADFRTTDMCWEALRQNGAALAFVPVDLLTPVMCAEAVRQNPWALRSMPKYLRTHDLSISAVQKRGDLLACIPSALRTKDLCFSAVSTIPYCVGDIPEHVLTPDMCLAAVEREGVVLKLVPEHSRTADICRAAVEQNGVAWAYVPEALRPDVSSVYKAYLEKCRRDGMAGPLSDLVKVFEDEGPRHVCDLGS